MRRYTPSGPVPLTPPQSVADLAEWEGPALAALFDAMIFEVTTLEDQQPLPVEDLLARLQSRTGTAVYQRVRDKQRGEGAGADHDAILDVSTAFSILSAQGFTFEQFQAMARLSARLQEQTEHRGESQRASEDVLDLYRGGITDTLLDDLEAIRVSMDFAFRWREVLPIEMLATCVRAGMSRIELNACLQAGEVPDYEALQVLAGLRPTN